MYVERTSHWVCSLCQIDVVSESGSTAEWVNVHASTQSAHSPGSLCENESESLSEERSSEQLLIAPGTCQLPVSVEPQLFNSSSAGNTPSVIAAFNSLRPHFEPPSSPEMTEYSSLHSGSVQFESQCAELQSSLQAERQTPDEGPVKTLLEATQPLAMEAALERVWDGTVRRIFTDKGRIVNLEPDDIVLKAKDLLQRLVALLCRDVGLPAGKQAAADMIAWMCADASCSRALQKPTKIISILVGLVCEDQPEIRRNVMRAIRNLVQQSKDYAKVRGALPFACE